MESVSHAGCVIGILAPGEAGSSLGKELATVCDSSLGVSVCATTTHMLTLSAHPSCAVPGREEGGRPRTADSRRVDDGSDYLRRPGRGHVCACPEQGHRRGRRDHVGGNNERRKGRVSRDVISGARNICKEETGSRPRSREEGHVQAARQGGRWTGREGLCHQRVRHRRALVLVRYGTAILTGDIPAGTSSRPSRATRPTRPRSSTTAGTPRRRTCRSTTRTCLSSSSSSACAT